MSSGRSLYKLVWTNFVKSLSPKFYPKGNLIGKDQFGNTYFEIPADPSVGKRKPARWYKTVEHEAFDQEVPVEWHAWLRGTRAEPPTQAEIDKNVAIAVMKKEKGDKILEKDHEYFKQKRLATGNQEPQQASFPTYDDYDSGGPKH